MEEIKTYGYTLEGYKEEVYTKAEIDNIIKSQPKIITGYDYPTEKTGKVGDIYIRLSNSN